MTAADQIIDRTILGCPVPDAACSILRAIDKQQHQVIQVAYNTVLEPIDKIERPEPTADEKHAAAALRWLAARPWRAYSGSDDRPGSTLPRTRTSCATRSARTSSKPRP